jgi:hypothetical protein
MFRIHSMLRSLSLSALCAALGCATQPAPAAITPAIASNAMSANGANSASDVHDAAPAAQSNLPDALTVPSGNALSFQADAKGVQIYVCKTSESAAAPSWQLSAPDAELFDASGKLAIKHYAGPTWESTDGSKVVGTKLTAATPDPRAIPWLLLQATSHEGVGSLFQVSFIQRRNTIGGLAPESGCDSAHLAQTNRVAYSARYYFYAPGAAPATTSP